jgi:hypothetical protein
VDYHINEVWRILDKSLLSIFPVPRSDACCDWLIRSGGWLLKGDSDQGPAWTLSVLKRVLKWGGHRFQTKKMLLTNHELTHAALSQQIVTAMLDPKQEMQNKEAERGKERQGEAGKGTER